MTIRRSVPHRNVCCPSSARRSAISSQTIEAGRGGAGRPPGEGPGPPASVARSIAHSTFIRPPRSWSASPSVPAPPGWSAMSRRQPRAGARGGDVRLAKGFKFSTYASSDPPSLAAPDQKPSSVTCGDRSATCGRVRQVAARRRSGLRAAPAAPSHPRPRSTDDRRRGDNGLSTSPRRHASPEHRSSTVRGPDGHDLLGGLTAGPRRWAASAFATAQRSTARWAMSGEPRGGRLLSAVRQLPARDGGRSSPRARHSDDAALVRRVIRRTTGRLATIARRAATLPVTCAVDDDGRVITPGDAVKGRTPSRPRLLCAC